MSKEALANFAGVVKSSLVKNGPVILTGLSIAGFVTTAVLTGVATTKAIRVIEEEKEVKGEDLTLKEKARVSWKYYIPPVATGIVSGACAIGAHSVSARRTAALAAAYQLSETALSEYRDKVIETIGEKKEKAVRDKVAKEKLEQNPVNESSVIITGKGKTLCFDSLSGRYFESDIESIKKAVNDINKRLLCDMYVSLNEFYDELDMDHTDIGEDLGWNLDGGLIDVYFSSQIARDDRPCIVLNYHVAPKYDYYKFV